jgi:serine/threonine protein kinase
MCLIFLMITWLSDVTLQQENILIDDAGHVRITDFGLTILVDELTMRKPNTGDRAAGTPRWMSPERLDSESGIQRISIAIDVYAFGLLCVMVRFFFLMIR